MKNFNERRELCQKLGLDSQELSSANMEDLKGSGSMSSTTAADAAWSGWTTPDYGDYGGGEYSTAYISA